MSDAIDKALSKFGDYDESEAFELLKAAFVLKSPEARIEDLRSAEMYLDQYTQPTKEMASTLTKCRELAFLHKTLRNAGR